MSWYDEEEYDETPEPQPDPIEAFRGLSEPELRAELERVSAARDALNADVDRGVAQAVTEWTELTRKQLDLEGLLRGEPPKPSPRDPAAFVERSVEEWHAKAPQRAAASQVAELRRRAAVIEAQAGMQTDPREIRRYAEERLVLLARADEMEGSVPFLGASESDLARRIEDAQVEIEEATERVEALPRDSARGRRAQAELEQARLHKAAVEAEIVRRRHEAALAALRVSTIESKAAQAVKDARQRRLAAELKMGLRPWEVEAAREAANEPPTPRELEAARAAAKAAVDALMERDRRAHYLKRYAATSNA